MLKNYIKIALRLLVKNKIYSLINILGLSTAIACCILITLYIQDEFSYEKGFKDYQKVFRINTSFIKEDGTDHSAYASPPIAPGLAQALPEIETYTRVMKPLNTEIHIVRYNDKSFFEKHAFLVDSTFLDVFPYELIEGNAETALDGPSSVLISEKVAEKVFGSKTSPLDETLIINSGTTADTFRITGVVATPSFPSHIDADFYMCMNSNGWGRWVLNQTTWANNNMVGSYLKLRNPEAYKELEAKFPQFIEMHAGEELRNSGRKKALTLQPLDEIRLYSESSDSTLESGNISYIYIISTIGIFILLLACINFMNLTTAKSAQRSSEVGIRKSMGAFRSNLIGQFLGESLVIVCFALVLAFIVVMLALPGFNTLMQKQLSFNANNLPLIIGATTLIALVTAILAGGYPAFFLSSLKPTQVLKGKSLSSDGSQWLRKSLVVIQFVITITLISSIVIIQKQLHYMQSKSLGFETDQVIMIPLRTAQAAEQYTALKTSFEQLSGVHVVSATTSAPSTPLSRDWGIYKKGWTNEQSLKHYIISVDKAYFDAMGIEIIAGRDFIIEQDNLAGDTVSTTKIILNEASLKAFGIPLEEAIGTSIYFEPGGDRYEFTVIGVVKDFHQFSLHNQIEPMLFMLPSNRNYFPYLTASINMKTYSETSAAMKNIWDERINNAPFENIFLNENIRKLYADEARTSTILTISTLIALLISCLGLYGLSVYVAERKTKEIGIRKVVGASVSNIVGMLSKEYIRLILISFLVAAPLGFYFMQKWLEGFAYKINPGITVFLIAGAISFMVAWLTISFESWRAANKNPVDAFRSS